MQQDNQYLIDILHAAQRIEEYIADITLANFYEDVQLQDKVIRRLLSISKNAKRVSTETRQETGAIAWHTISQIKERLLENDPFVDIDQLWNMSKNEVPKLVRTLDQQISEQSQSGLSFAGIS